MKVRAFALVLFALLLLVAPAAAAADGGAERRTDGGADASTADASAAPARVGPRLADDHIVLRTTLGDIVLGLYPDVAPKHVEQLTKLARNHVFDGVYFYRVDPSFVIQVTTANDRREPMTREQAALVHPLPAEFSQLVHRRYTLSMAHDDGKPDSAETSFSILLDNAPHLDGKYTIFGEVVDGMDVVDSIADVDRDEQNRPLERVWVDQAFVVAEADLPKTTLRGASPREHTTAARRGETPRRPYELEPKMTGPPPATQLGAIGVMMLLGLGVFLRIGKSSPKVIASLGLLVVFVGFFLAFTLLSETSRTSSYISVPLFAATIGILKLMGRFEGPVAADAPKKG